MSFSKPIGSSQALSEILNAEGGLSQTPGHRPATYQAGSELFRALTGGGTVQRALTGRPLQSELMYRRLTPGEGN